MLQKALILLILLIPTVGWSDPCKDRLKEFEKAKSFGATNFKCHSEYDGRVTSSWIMSPEDYQKFKEALILKNRDRIKGTKNGGKK